MSDPQVHGNHEGTEDIAGGQRIHPLLCVLFHWFRPERAVVLRAGDDIDAHLIWRRNVASFAVRVRETPTLLPVLRGSLRVKNIRVGLGPFQYAVPSTGLCILQDVVGVGKKLRFKLVGMLL